MVCLGSPMQSLLAQVTSLGIISISSFSSFLPQWSRSNWWFALSRSASPEIYPGVNVRKVSLSSEKRSAFYPLGRPFAHPFSAIGEISESLRLLSVSIISQIVTPLIEGARVPFYLVGTSLHVHRFARCISQDLSTGPRYCACRSVHRAVFL